MVRNIFRILTICLTVKFQNLEDNFIASIQKDLVLMTIKQTA